ncbi:GNAT family N-acetyltransferase [Nocardia sp. CDC159]|uniref:GNAT family N-acetyltransferase n=1 Tax=Nocardia pulmonis TaxID=2951408 RepID=A0A9X2IXN5_9NOCA|nr:MULTISPECIES: GNAT family N-acetyltransferase [Nocardia]MCM6773036.1 GNAT family N-acetyltransferase [Nocardia pulmonis]MCM6785661.1 GNAT family N-acetyltransferase [Nocardia sp. CDC159]
MALPSGISLRSGTSADEAALGVLLANAFGGPTQGDPELHRYRRQIFPAADAVVALDGERIVGNAMYRTMTLTVPGERTVAACGIAGVAVAPTHRRRGLLRAMYTELHRRTEAAGLPLTIFTASQGGIYGRFGYGPATVENRVTIDRRFAEFRPTTPDPGGVALLSFDDALPQLPAIYDRWRRRTPGAQMRPEANWRVKFFSPRGEDGFFALLHPDGYAIYRHRHPETGLNAEVFELRAVTDEAHAALWRALLGLDLVTVVDAVVTDDDPLPHLLTDPRLVRTVSRHDGLWARLMDVPAALSARSYQHDLDVVLAVTDPFRDAGGVFALRARDGSAECVPTDRPADFEMGIDVLGSMYLGAHRARTFAAANRLQAKDSDSLRALDLAFAAEGAAELGWFF